MLPSINVCIYDSSLAPNGIDEWVASSVDLEEKSDKKPWKGFCWKVVEIY